MIVVIDRDGRYLNRFDVSGGQPLWHDPQAVETGLICMYGGFESADADVARLKELGVEAVVMCLAPTRSDDWVTREVDSVTPAWNEVPE